MTSICVDRKDRVWTLNQIDPFVQVYSVDGEFLFAWGGEALSKPHHVHIDRQDNVWIADIGLHVVRNFTPEGKLLLTLGTPNEPGEDAHHLNRPTGTTTTPEGEVFISDGYGNDRVVHFNAKGEFVKSWGKQGTKRGELSQPHAIAIDSKGRLYVAERNNGRVQVFDQKGESLAEWRNLINPWGIWITPKDEVVVCGSTPARWDDRPNLGNPPRDAVVMKFDTTGRALEIWSFPLVKAGAPEPGAVDWPHGIALDSKGNLYLGDVADTSTSHRAQKFVRLPADQ